MKRISNLPTLIFFGMLVEILVFFFFRPDGGLNISLTQLKEELNEKSRECHKP